jgi:S-adenosylmethionine:tRNA ribosyltransferase-isomerase
MRVDLFDFELPPERIALRPARPRDSARLLEVRGSEIFDRNVLDLPELLQPGDVLVFNDTKVIPGAARGLRGRGEHRRDPAQARGPREWQAFLRNAKRARIGDTIDFGEGVRASVVEKAGDGTALLHFHGEEPVELLLERAGRMPLPPYIASKRATTTRTAPTTRPCSPRGGRSGSADGRAALHRAADRGARRARIARETLTLHVGAGTFLPVKAEDTADHRMHAEWGRIDSATAERLNAARAAGGRLIAVGTTSLRLLESAAGEDGRIAPFEGDTCDLHHARIPVPRDRRPHHQLPFAQIDLFMLVSALMGLEVMKAAYAHAIAGGYRFYSYGDASLLLPERASQADGRSGDSMMES